LPSARSRSASLSLRATRSAVCFRLFTAMSLLLPLPERQDSHSRWTGFRGSGHQTYLLVDLDIPLEDVREAPEERPVPKVGEQLEAALLVKKHTQEGQASSLPDPVSEGGDDLSLSKAQETGEAQPVQTPLEPVHSGREAG
jgi:hypothetical protein